MRTSERTSRVAKLKYFGKKTKSGIAGKLPSAAKTENLGTSLRTRKGDDDDVPDRDNEDTSGEEVEILRVVKKKPWRC